MVEIDWLMIVSFLHSTAIGVVVYFLCRRTEKARLEVVDFFRNTSTNREAMSCEFINAERDTRKVLMEQYRVLLEHAAGMHQGQALTSNEVVRFLTQHQTSNLVRVLEAVSGRSPGTSGGESLVDGLPDVVADIGEIASSTSEGETGSRIRNTIPATEM